MTVRRVAARGVLALSAVLAMATGAGVGAAEPGSTDQCGRWTASTVSSGLGVLENLAFDGRGGLLLSEVPASGTDGALRRIRADGVREVLAFAGSPGGIVVSGSTAYFTNGGSLISGVAGRADGVIQALDLDRGTVSTVARGLVAPNGLAVLPDGGFVVSRDVGTPTTLTRVAADGSLAPLATDLTSTNGLAYDPNRRKLFVSTTFEPVSALAVLDMDRPDVAPVRITVPGYGPLNAADDLTVGPDGNVYLALNVAGRIVRVDPETGRSCTVAEDISFPTSARFGAGHGWDPRSLYVTSFAGTVTRLTPTA
ncbi:SMP-30/gluconolactonase/LRE family protein [Nocardia altamirensis]|uniref:SMP-30/gluconolactonase/LRE family protein n=1 Tax=Nocardia altamirensis TaxID=472158 RepID=UPI0008407948|nr:SMP-30/gluconolactonase/LRE family protein [Nocardia altamirensis]